jgi:hypothetical protein
MSDSIASASILIIFPRAAAPFARAVRDILTTEGFVVDLNDETLLDVNDQLLETTLNRSGYYDFCVALLPGPSPDAVGVPGGLEDALFEFGLFLGRLGPRRVFPLVGGDLTVLTHWRGVKFETYDPQAEPREAVAAGCAQIIEAMRRAEQSASLPMLPSTALAIGYYRNFIERVLVALSNDASVAIESKLPDGRVVVEEAELDPDELTIEIRVPRNLRELAERPVAAQTDRYRHIVVRTLARPFPFYIDLEDGPGSRRLVDVPTTLISASYTIDELFSPDFLAR